MISNVLEFWQAIEALTPQDALRVNASDVANPVYGIHNHPQALFPWANPEHLQKPIDADMVWAYEVQCGIHDTSALSALLVEALNKTPRLDDEFKGSTSRVFDLRFDETGMPLPQTFSLSLASWASGQLLVEEGSIQTLLAGGVPSAQELPEPGSDISDPQSGFAAFDSLSMGIVQWIANEVEGFEKSQTRPTVGWLSDLLTRIAEFSHLPKSLFGSRAFVRVRATRVRKDKAHEKGEFVDGLGSFYAADLRKIAAAAKRGDIGAGMRQFMSAGKDGAQADRIDVRDPANNGALAEALAPTKIPMGRWPSDHALAFSQQLAVNGAFASLERDAGLFAVNGPPGTGKTTLLRDVVAAVITKRAAALVELGAQAFGSKSVTKLGDVVVPFYALHKKLHGHSIVVATENNGAAENVTRELPGRDAVPARVLEKASYFPELAGVVAGKDAWALIAAPLGNRKNRTDFVSRFWWGERATRAASNAPAMREHLKTVAREEGAPASRWTDAVSKFKNAVKNEAARRKHVVACANLPAKIAELTIQIQSAEAAKEEVLNQLTLSSQWLLKAEKSLFGLRIKADAATEQEQSAERAMLVHDASKPGVFQNLWSLGKASGKWRNASSRLSKTHAEARDKAANVRSETGALEMQVVKTKLAHNVLPLKKATQERHVVQLRADRSALESQLEACADALGSAWLDVDADPSAREHTTPWGEAAWLSAREDVFLAALDVHRAFIEAHPQQMGANLALASDWLSGKRLSPELVTLALESLCMVVPVVSATFASFPRMFGAAQKEAIGWLLIDEAGQAQSPHAVCAIWRARRTVMVGDPLQLEPVFTLQSVVEAELARYFGVREAWMPGWFSAQALADQSSRLGTMLGQEDGEGIWIGCPLRLHRRCAPVMFDISNEIAYSGMMVYGKKTGQDEPWPESVWLDVKADTSEGHWIDADGERLQSLLQELIGKGVGRDQIAMVSPFRDCANRLRRIARIYELDTGKAGTVHTAQGKEADVVILVLGGNPKSAGAKAWAASKPNLLNVAVSRGKKRLYVIGDVDQWRKHSYFSVMAQILRIESACCA